MWFWTWLALILASLAAGAWGAWHLWLKSKDLTGALGELGALVGSVPGRVSAQASTLTLSEPRGPDVFSDPHDPHDPQGPRALVEQRRALRAQRAQVRRAAHADRYESWRRIDL